MVGDDEHVGFRKVHGPEQPRDFPVQQDVIIMDRMLERVALFKLPVLRVHEMPKPVMDPVAAHLHHYEKIRHVLRQHSPRDREPPPGHLVDVLENARLVRAAKIRHVEEVIPPIQPARDLLLERRRRGPWTLEARRQEAAYHRPIDGPRDRVSARHAKHRAFLPARGKNVPKPVRLHPIASGEPESLVSMVRAIPKAVNSQRTGIHAAGHARPRRHRDRRHATPHPPPQTRLPQPRESR